MRTPWLLIGRQNSKSLLPLVVIQIDGRQARARRFLKTISALYLCQGCDVISTSLTADSGLTISRFALKRTNFASLVDKLVEECDSMSLHRRRRSQNCTQQKLDTKQKSQRWPRMSWRALKPRDRPLAAAQSRGALANGLFWPLHRRPTRQNVLSGTSADLK